MLAGIARHAFPKAPMEVVDQVEVTIDGGIQGDFRGAVKPGGRGKRQVTLMERADWSAAMRELDADVPWQERRVNLLVAGFDLPQVPGALLRIGSDVVLRVMVECDPCSRMELILPGLKAALMPDWRGGVCSRVVSGGTIRVGDAIVMEQV